MQDGSTLHLVDSEVADNLAFGFGGGLLMLNSTVTCTATSPGSAGILHNGLYGVYLFPGPFTSTGCDFGEPGTLDDNLGPDVGNSSFFGAAFGDGVMNDPIPVVSEKPSRPRLGPVTCGCTVATW